jgi:hypothetical protein
MSSRISIIKGIVLVAVLAAGVSGMARADDSSMNPFTGDSYAYFNGGYDRPQIANATFDKASSVWRQANPNGLSERQLQAISSEAPAYALSTPIFDTAPSAWRQANPNGLSERQFQALSSEAPAWHSPNQSATTALASTDGTVIAQSAAK